MQTNLRSITTAAALVVVLATQASAQAFDGKWITEIARRMENVNGVMTESDKAKVRITLRQQGDSLFGTWAMVEAPAGTPSRELRGTVSERKATLSMQVEGIRNMNGVADTVRVTVVYEFTLSGDRLEGTSTSRGPEGSMPPRPFLAVRETE